MNVSIIGSGNLAWHLAPALDNTEFSVREVYSQQTRNAEALVKRLYNAKVRPALDFSGSPSNIFILAVPDDAIEEVAGEILLPDGSILLHTSGSQPLNALEDLSAARKVGVFYPLQTFTKSRNVDFSEIPVFIESDDKATEKILLAMAGAITKKVYKISSPQRMALHVAAVFASNFTNHMLTVSREVLQDHKLDFEWLKPLIVETVNKSLSLGPQRSQTGPAKRADLETLDKHVAFLSEDAAVAEIYKVISQHILDRYADD